MHGKLAKCFTLCWINFSGIIEEPGSFEGKINSAIPDLGPELTALNHLLIYNKPQLMYLQHLNNLIMAHEKIDSNLFKAVLNG